MLMKFKRCDLKCVEAISTIKDLQLLRSVYIRLMEDPFCHLYEDAHFKLLIRNTNEEIERLSDLMYNSELEDSYDQNTGKVVNLSARSREMGELLRFCGGPVYDSGNKKR